MLFRIESEPEETLRACQAVARATAAVLPPSSAGWITIASYVAAGAAAYLLAVRDWLLVGVLAGAGILLATLGVNWEARWRGRRLLALDPHVREPHQLELSPAGLRSWCAHVDLRITWDAITRIEETTEFYVFVRGSGGAPALPKRLLDAEQDRALRAALQEWAPADSLYLAQEPGGVRSPAPAT